MTRPRLFLFTATLIVGITVGELWRPPVWPWLIGALISCMVLPRRWRIAAVMWCGLAIGMWRIDASLSIQPHDVATLIGRTVVLTGVVNEPPTRRDGQQRIVWSDLRSGDDRLRHRLLLYAPQFPVVTAASTVSAECRIVALTARTEKQQWSHGIHARCLADRITVLDRRASSVAAYLGRWQEFLLGQIRRRFSEPQASLLNGILFGNTDGMTEELQTAFQATGTTHIVALSGFNVTIIITMVIAALTRLVGRRWSWVPALAFIIGFVVMTGASASVVRAATMATIVQAGTFFGRPVSPARLITYAGVLMVVVNPLLLWHDLGFQLSFLATCGLVFGAERMASRLTLVAERWGIRQNLATTMAAIASTEPLLLWRFGRVSLIAPLINLLVLPLVPITMALGAVSILGSGVPVFNAIIVPPTDAMLRLIIALISMGAQVPGAALQLATVSAVVCGAVAAGWCVHIFTLTHDPTTDLLR